MPQGPYPFCFRFLPAHAARPVRHSLLISQGDRFAATGDLAGHKYLASTGVSLRSEHLYLIAFLEVQLLVAQEAVNTFVIICSYSYIATLAIFITKTKGDDLP